MKLSAETQGAIKNALLCLVSFVGMLLPAIVMHYSNRADRTEGEKEE